MWVLILIDKVVKNLLNLFFPPVCLACQNILGDRESVICTECRHKLPVTNVHLNGENAVEKVFYGRVQLEAATALFYYQKKGRVQELMHNLKYRGQEQIGSLLGAWLGSELKLCTPFNTVEMVIPIPLHESKLKKRGYNQVAKFGQEIANALNAEYREDILVKVRATTTKVFRDRLARWSEDDYVFNLNNEHEINGKHILVVDDIITTGATLEQSCLQLLEATPSKISVATMAITV